MWRLRHEDLQAQSSASVALHVHIPGPELMFAKRDKQDPSRSGQTSLATAGVDFTKPVINLWSYYCSQMNQKWKVSLQHCHCLLMRTVPESFLIHCYHSVTSMKS